MRITKAIYTNFVNFLESEEFEDEFEKAAAMDTSDIKKESSNIFII